MKKIELPVRGQLVKCRECGKHILIERALFGIDHTAETFATCWECLDDASRKRATEMYKLNDKVGVA